MNTLHAGLDELQQVAVERHEVGLDALFLRLPRQRAEHIVGLEPGLFERRAC